MKKRWAARPAPRLEISDAPNPHGLPASVALLLARRGYSGERLTEFLNPDMKNLSSWRDIGGIEAAAGRIANAVRKGERILVHGDFDADGITATAVVYSALRNLDADAGCFIPDRFDDGYGLGDSSLRECRETGTGLLVTVDCGVSDVSHVEALKEMGVDTVITDHHQPGPQLPSAAAIVDPSLEQGSAFSILAGAGVAWMVMQGVYEMMGIDGNYLNRLLQLVAIGTVADVVDLTGDNRIMVSEGIDLIRRDPMPGIEALAASASRELSNISSTDLAYYLGPRLNACGRVGHADDALRLLLAEDPQAAANLVARVETHNRERRKLDREVEDQVLASLGKLEKPRFIMMSDQGWHRGVIGIVASRLANRYGVPSLMISMEEETGFGSARSVPGIHIHSILSDIQSRTGIMESLGGHPMAAGFRIPVGNLDLLRSELNGIFADDRWDRHLGSVLYLDGSLEEEDYRAETVRALEMLEPFGEGNRRPVWLARGAYPVQWRTVGKDASHLSCNFRIGSTTRRAIGFGMVDKQSLFGGRVDLAFTLSLDTWRNDGSVQLILKDIRKCRTGVR